jgi:hypothetical protein
MSFLQGGSTKWVLFLASSSQAEQRHIMDLAFGIHSLEKAGVSEQDIFVYIDGSDTSNINQWLAHGSVNQYIVKPTQEFFIDQKSNSHENLIMFITGHGSIEGLDASTSIAPSQMVECLKNSPNLQRAVVYFGQCDAGIFNFMSVGRTARGQQEHDPDIVFVGATNLHASVSSPTTESLASGAMPWVANLFLLYVFHWIQKPVDVDGDGKYTIMDSYKFAGAKANSENKLMKLQGFVDCVNLHQQCRDAGQAMKQSPDDLNAKLNYESFLKSYSNKLDLQFVHQEPWILNSRPAQLWEL